MPRTARIDASGAFHHIIARKYPREWFRQGVCCAIGLKLSQPAVSLSVKRGEKIGKENQYSLLDDMNL